MKLSFLFPGQGSQTQGMMESLAHAYPLINETLLEASDVLEYNLLRAMADENKINQTVYTQPCILAASIAIYHQWLALGGPKPQIAAGHSLGEYTALCAAGSLSLAESLKLVQARGQFMQAAVAEGVGGMAAVIGCDNERIENLCRQVGFEGVMISAANYNAQGQVVVAGHRQAIILLHQLGQKEGFKVMPLPVSVPSHCVLMTPASKQLQQEFKEVEFTQPEFEILHNIDAKSRTTDNDIKQALIAQVCEPVRWTKIMDSFVSKEVTHYVECGPGKILSGLGRRQNTPVKILSTHSPQDFEAAIAQFTQ